MAKVTKRNGAKKVGNKKMERTSMKSFTRMAKVTKPKSKQKVKVDPLSRISGMSLNSGESKIEKLGKTQVLISRDKYLDRNGNPVYRASVIDASGKTGKLYKSSAYEYAAEKALEGK